MYLVSKQSTLKTISTHLWLDLLKAEIHRDIINNEIEDDYTGATMSTIVPEDESYEVIINKIEVDVDSVSDDEATLKLFISDSITVFATIDITPKQDTFNGGWTWDVNDVVFFYNLEDCTMDGSKPIEFSNATKITLTKYVKEYVDKENVFYDHFQEREDDEAPCKCLDHCRC